MFHHILSEFMGTALMIVFGVGVHCDDVLKRTKYAGSGHMFAITTWAFGISVVLFVFGGVCINPAMALAQAILGMIPWSYFIPYVIAEMLGGICGAVIVYIMYADHFKLSADSVDPIAIRNIFLQIRTNEIYQETILLKLLQHSFLTSILAIAHSYETQLPIAVGLLVWAIGMGLGGTTGFAMNQARDLGPRIAYQLLPIKNKTNNDWQYGLIVPGTAPF